MCLTVEGPSSKSRRVDLGQLPFRTSAPVCRTGHGVRAPKVQQTSGDGEAAMTTVYVVTAGSGDSYRIERVYLDRDRGLRVRPGLQRHCAG